MAELVYLMCALTSLACAVLLARSYRHQRVRLLLWSTVCFGGLAVSNTLLFVDLVVVPDIDLSVLRSSAAFLAIVLLLVGMIWEVR
jgi:hypothetical protein